MKKEIIVAIDFSDCSINAFEHAITIAQRAKADIRLVWVNKATQQRTVALKSPEEALADALQTFEEMVATYESKLGENTIDYKIREGKVYREIINQAKEDDAFLIVAGTHGSSGFEEFWIGSNAQKIVSASLSPVITIRGGVKIDRNLTKIILPVDSTLETRQKVPFTALIAKYFEAKVYVLSIYTTEIETIRRNVEKYSRQVTEYLEENEIPYELDKIESDNLTDSTIDFALKKDANLISIMTEQEKTTKNLWLGPYAHQMVNHSPVPVLSIHPKEYLQMMSR
jgi:nucleotide-binding universal stress UspA family protein